MKDITNPLPAPILAHIAAYQANDLDAQMAISTPDALLNDARRKFVGHDAIRAWANHEIIEPKVTMVAEQAFDNRGSSTVHARVDDDFDKTNPPNPLVLSDYFSLAGDKISQLIILANKARG